jgi:hypothetical protein
MINPFKEINWKPQETDLKKFAVSLLIGFPVIAIFFFLFKWLSAKALPEPGFYLWLAAIGAGVGLVCLLIPMIARPLYYVWYTLAACIGIVLANLLFCLLFYALFTPLGLFMRLFGRDALRLKNNPETATYWREAPPTPPAKQYFRQF